MASRNEQIRSSMAAGLSIREIEAATGIPRSTVQRIGSAGASRLRNDLDSLADQNIAPHD